MPGSYSIYKEGTRRSSVGWPPAPRGVSSSPWRGEGGSPTTEGSCSEGKHSERFEMQRIESQTERSSNLKLSSASQSPIDALT